MDYQISGYSNLLVEVATDLSIPPPTQILKPALPIELIGLHFTLRNHHSYFDISENGEWRLVQEREGMEVPLCDHQFQSEIFNRGNDTLHLYLTCSFQSLEPEIDAEFVAEALIERWIEIKDEVNSRSLDRVFTMTVNLTLWIIEARHEIGNIMVEEDYGMIPTCSKAATMMLKKFEMEKVEGDCVICLEELKKKRNGVWGLQMPCLHVFHETCIQDWLKNSHFCPICRFEMPIPGHEVL